MNPLMVVPRQRKTKTGRAKPVDHEGLEQAALLAEIRLRYPVEADLIYHVPNGGHRHVLVAVKLKGQGVVAGIPDLVFTMARGGYFGLYMEFKATPPRDAAVSPSQHVRIQKLNEQGYLAIVCRGHFDAMEAFRTYMRLPLTVVAA